MQCGADRRVQYCKVLLSAVRGTGGESEVRQRPRRASRALAQHALVITAFIGPPCGAFFPIPILRGDPIETRGGERGFDRVPHEQLRAESGFDKPVLVQYGLYIGRPLHGDLGRSIVTREPVIAEFAVLFPATVELALCAMLFAVLIGLPAGILSALKRNSVFDHGVIGASLAGYSMPIFWCCRLLILLCSLKLDLTPVSGRIAVQYYVEPVTGFLLIDTLLSDDQGAFPSALSHIVR